MATTSEGDPPGSRLTAVQIFARAVEVGEEDLKRSAAGLAFSGLAAGLAMGLSGLGTATIAAQIGLTGWRWLVARLLSPLGFIAVIVGRAQLFTENTLFPAEILSSVLGGQVSVGDYLYWLSAAVLGNAIGGVVIVSLLNYGQVIGGGRDQALLKRPLEEAEQEHFGRRRSEAASD